MAELRYRFDGFTPERQKTFLKALRRTGCVSDAARKAGITRHTVARTRAKFADFDGKCKAMIDLAVPKLEAIAFERATVGAKEKVWRKGKVVQVKQKPSDSMLRLLLIGAAPKKYGRFAGLPRAAPGRGDPASGDPAERIEFDDAIGLLDTKLEAFGARLVAEEGYTEGPNGEMVPPGWRMVREEELKRLGWTPPPPEGGGEADGVGDEAGGRA